MADKMGDFTLEKDDKAYVLQLFIAGASPNFARAIINLKAIPGTHLKRMYKLDIIDADQQSDKAEYRQTIPLPSLIKKSPGIERMLIGDMLNRDKVLSEVELNPVDE